MDSADSSLTCPACGCADFGEVPAEPDRAAAPSPPAHGTQPPQPPDTDGDPAQARQRPPRECWLRVAFEAGRQAWQLEVAPGSKAELGRDPGYAPRTADSLAADDTVSRRHGVIGLDPDGSAWICDVGSANGTFVNGQLLPKDPKERRALRHGDRLQLGLETRGEISLVTAPPGTLDGPPPVPLTEGSR
jgi:hypothetical protein